MSILPRTKPPQLDGRSKAAEFLDEHDRLTQEVMLLTDHNTSLVTQNTSLLAEVAMLREELERSDRDRTRLQGFAAALATRLSVIQETISVALNEAAAHKIQPEQKPQEKTEYKPAEIVAEARDTAEVRDIVSRLPPNQFMR